MGLGLGLGVRVGVRVRVRVRVGVRVRVRVRVRVGVGVRAGVYLHSGEATVQRANDPLGHDVADAQPLILTCHLLQPALGGGEGWWG